MRWSAAGTLLASALVACSGAPIAWNNFMRARVWEPEHEFDFFQLEPEPLDEAFATDQEGVTVTIGETHACAIEAVEGVEVGGAIVCWSDRRDMKGLTASPEVRLTRHRVVDEARHWAQRRGRLFK
jgi:hypothetical protein